MGRQLRTALKTGALCLALLTAGAMVPSAVIAQAPDQASDQLSGQTRREAPDEVSYPVDQPAEGAPAPDAAAAPEAEPAVDPAPQSQSAAQFADWVIATHDNHDLFFVIVDKVQAEVFVYGPDGKLMGSSPALVGLAHGDDSTPGIGDLKLSAIPPDERTTPAGRFVAGFGPSAGGRRVLWVDYVNAVSMHGVVSANRKERRLQRLSSPTPDDNRITYGCINVPAAFYEEVVRPAFTGASGIVYVLPETRRVEEVFPSYRPQDPVVSASAVDTAPAASGLEAAPPPDTPGDTPQDGLAAPHDHQDAPPPQADPPATDVAASGPGDPIATAPLSLNEFLHR